VGRWGLRGSARETQQPAMTALPKLLYLLYCHKSYGPANAVGLGFNVPILCFRRLTYPFSCPRIFQCRSSHASLLKSFLRASVPFPRSLPKCSYSINHVSRSCHSFVYVFFFYRAKWREQKGGTQKDLAMFNPRCETQALHMPSSACHSMDRPAQSLSDWRSANFSTRILYSGIFIS